MIRLDTDSVWRLPDSHWIDLYVVSAAPLEYALYSVCFLRLLGDLPEWLPVVALLLSWFFQSTITCWLTGATSTSAYKLIETRFRFGDKRRVLLFILKFCCCYCYSASFHALKGRPPIWFSVLLESATTSSGISLTNDSGFFLLGLCFSPCSSSRASG